jgi:hypothetical protein
MPAGDGTGPMGMGPMTGRRFFAPLRFVQNDIAVYAEELPKRIL